MGTTAQKLQAIQNSKAAIKSAIEAKGVSDVGDVLADYATKIGQISGGGSSGDPRYEVSEQGALSKKSFALNWFNNVTSIPNNGLEYAYYKSNVTSASFPNLTSVGDHGLDNAFRGCTSLATVDLSKVTSVGNYGLQNAFNGCTSLTSVDLSNLTTANGIYVFYQTFSGCSSLTSFDLPSLTSVGGNGMYYAFSGCTSLATVDLSSVTTIESYALYNAFSGCTSLTSVDLSSMTSVNTFGLGNTFYGCTSLRTVLLKKLSSTTSAFTSTFGGCTNLELVDFSEATAVPTLGSTNVFNNTNNYYRIVVPNALYNQWITSTNWSDSSIVTHIEKAIKGLVFKAGAANSTVALTAVGTPTSIDIEYSTDGGATFSPYTVGTTVTLSNVNDVVMFRAGSTGQTALADDSSNYHKFTMTGSISVEDSLVWLLNRQGTEPQTLADYAFYGLFNGCAVLQNAPELPFTSIGDYSYAYMFAGCTGLTTAPELPATTLGDYCYSNMFNGCTGLTTAPTLSNTSLTEGCYEGMFKGCTSITEAPTLPATTLATGCYNEMFYGCSSLDTISLGYTGNFSTTYFNDWVYGVAASGTFVYFGNDTTRGTSAIPSGWTVPTVVYKNYINTNIAELNTGVVPTTTTKVVGRFRGSAVGNWFVGSSDTKWRGFNSQNTFYLDLNGMSARISKSGWDTTKWYDVEYGNFYFNCVPVDGGTTISQSSTARSFTHTTPLMLGSATYQWAGEYEKFDCAGFKIYDGTTLVKDYRPALDGNGVACFYEEVSGTYAYPSSGTFLAY